MVKSSQLSLAARPQGRIWDIILRQVNVAERELWDDHMKAMLESTSTHHAT
jgi:hypothetical protein